MIVHGGRALNAHLPEWLERNTRDWDIFTPDNANETASILEKRLDKHYGGDYFLVEPALHPGTFKIKSRVTGDTLADITVLDKKVECKNIRGINYATLEYHEDHIEKTLQDPATRFRQNKDTETLQRIAIYRKAKKDRRVRPPSRKTPEYRGSDSIMDIGIANL